MRVVIVGRPVDRDRLRRSLPAEGVSVVGEAATIAEAHARGDAVDAYLLAARPSATSAAVAEDDTGDSVFLEALTPREVEVLEVLAEGLPNKAIARRLSISDQTVKFHIAAICSKLGVHNRTGAVRVAIQRGIIAV
jgi:DNA-binding NarL/FixJ family response regulator